MWGGILESSKYRLIIFDWDGTLMDSADRIAFCMRKAAEDAQVEVPSVDEVKEIIGLGLPEAIKKLMPLVGEDDREEVEKYYRYHFINNRERTSVFFDGALQALDELLERGFILAVATGKSRRGLNREFEKHSVGHYFVESRCADETRSKPDPLMLHEILQSTNCVREQAVIIGDTEYDMDMGRQAGIDRIGVTYGVHSKDRLEAFEPEVCLDAINELVPWLVNSSER
ncbi:MAG: HAD family hydrolase [Gammaproteobacteria bacterium]|nr:MAG: HAD family hydrolase [Gammaproteobacteria bacterium]